MALHPRVSTAGDLFAALPVLLGFHPTDSVVLVTVHYTSAGSFTGPVLRKDLTQCFDPATAGFAQAARMCFEEGAAAVLVLVVDTHALVIDPAGTTVRAAQHQELLHRLTSAFTAVGVNVQAAFCTTAIAEGARWWSLLEDGHGVVPDPAASPITAEDTALGLPTSRERSALADTLARDPVLAEQVRIRLPDAVRVADQEQDRLAAAGDQLGYPRRAAALVQSHMDDPEIVSAELLAELAVALRNVLVRDCMFGFAATGAAHSAQRLWTLLVRALPDPDRSNAAVLLSYSAYFHHNKPLAEVAITAALASDRHHKLARLLDTALSTGTPPESLHQLAGTGMIKAAALGLHLPDTPDTR